MVQHKEARPSRSAFQVNADQLKALPALRVDKMLDGLIPGVKIDPNTDSPIIHVHVTM